MSTKFQTFYITIYFTCALRLGNRVNISLSEFILCLGKYVLCEVEEVRIVC